MCTTYMLDFLGDPKSGQSLSGTGFRIAMGVLGTELRSSGKELFFVSFEKSLQPPLRPCFEMGCCFPSAGVS